MSDIIVKPLEWQELRPNDDNGFAQDAYSPIGHYIATEDGWFLVGQTQWADAFDLEHAKAAAQADFDARIRSALVERKAEPVAWEEFLGGLETWCCELPDRTSPEDAPEMMLIDRNELHMIAEQVRDFLAAAPEPVTGDGEALPIEEIQMEDWSSGYAEPTEPTYRIEVNGYCADFPSRTAAENFRRAVYAALSASPVGESREALVKALEQIADYTRRCDHDLGFDREMGPLGCSLGDRCVCLHIHMTAIDALAAKEQQP